MDAALVVLDGWGLPSSSAADATEVSRDAIATADTPTFDRIRSEGAVGSLRADGETVGLPPGRMGNSAVGHLTIGAGRAIEQPFLQINRSIDAGDLGEQPVLAGLLDRLADRDGRLHLWGLVSDGGVHGDLDHLRALVRLAGDAGVATVTHAVTDGRDTHPTCATRLLRPLERTAEAVGTGDIVTVTGRYFAMDRDEHWERTSRAAEAVVHGRGRRVATSAVDAVEQAYAVGQTDEFIQPTVIDGGEPLEPGDGVLMANFRADRARQLTRMLTGIDPVWPMVIDPPAVDLVTMTTYDRTFDLPVVFEPTEPTVTLGSTLAEAGLTQLRVAESEKYPHVTYFINGGREVRFQGELREIIPSPDVDTYDLQPAMSATAVTDTTLDRIDADDPDVLVLNYANPDMVGHTGVFEAVVEAVEAVDTELGRLLDGLPPCDVIVIADHGNAEDMGSPSEPHTAHTTNPVPCIYLDADGTGGGHRIRAGGTLADVTPTLLGLLDIPVPDEMTGTSLLE